MTVDAARDAGAGPGMLSRALAVLRRWLPAVLVAGVVIGAWEGLVAVNDVPSWKLPPPSGVAVEMWEARALLASHTWVTLTEVLAGFAIALVAGVTLAGLISISSTMARVLYPPVIASETVPWIVIAPLLLIWVGYGMQHKVIVVALIALFPIVVNTADGLRSADPDMVSLLRALGASRRQIFAKVQVPSSLPSLFSGIKIAVTASVIGAVVGRVGRLQRGPGLPGHPVQVPVPHRPGPGIHLSAVPDGDSPLPGRSPGREAAAALVPRRPPQPRAGPGIGKPTSDNNTHYGG